MNEYKSNRQLNARLKSSLVFRELEEEVNRIEQTQSTPSDETLQRSGAVIGRITIR